MATESPISLNGHSYLSGKSVIPNRSGSAPPNMEGSLASIENLMHKYGLDSNLASLQRSHFHQSFPSGFDQRVVSSDMAKQLKSSSFRASSENFLQLYQTSLSTCKEESEDDKSPQKSSNDLTQQRSAVWSEQESNSCIGQSISVADHMKDDLTSISSTTSDQPNASCHGPDVDGSNSHDVYISSFPENSTAVSAAVASDISVNCVASSVHVNRNSQHGSFSSIQTDFPNNRGLVSGEPDVVSIQSGIKAMKLAYPPNLEQHGGQGEWQNNFPTNMQYQVHQPSGNFQHQGSMPHIASQGTVPSYVISDQILHGGKLSSAEAQPVLHSSVFAPPLYATASATYYAGYQPPGVVYSPLYGIGGYPYNSVPPPYFGGYPPHNAAPLAFDVINSPVSWVSTEEDVDMHHMNKLCGPPHGFMQHFVDPRLQFHPSFGNLYNIPDQADPLALRGGAQKQRASGQANAGQRTREIAETDFTASQTGNALLMHVPNLPRPNSLLPGSVTGVSNIPCGKVDVGLPNSGTNASFYTDWQSQRGFENFNHQERAFSYLEELKSGKGRRVDLSDIVGHMVEFSVDQHGSRFIQQKLEHCSSEEMACVFQEILPHACKLMADVFGNYVIQKFFEYGTCDQRKHLAYALSGQIVPLSLQMYGCRVIQKALDVIEVDQKIALVRELDGHVMRCVRDQNGNHVIQKCIGCIPTEKIGFIISAFRGQVANLSMHPYGCRVIQRVMEYCTDELQTRFIVDEILDSVCALAHDQYGNYVTQHVLERGKPQERNQIIRNLSGKVVKMSQHKFASNVIEKCLEYADAAGRELLIGEVMGLNEGTDNLLVMMKDQYANYVVQKMLEKCTDAQRDLLLGLISVHLNGLKKYTYGKHIVSRFEQLFGELEAPKS